MLTPPCGGGEGGELREDPASAMLTSPCSGGEAGEVGGQPACSEADLRKDLERLQQLLVAERCRADGLDRLLQLALTRQLAPAP